jgi:hypothetical protein
MNQVKQHRLVIDLLDRGFSGLGLVVFPPGLVKCFEHCHQRIA